MHITIISEDRVHARILEENLQRRAFQVVTIVVGQPQANGLAQLAFAPDTLLVLDLGWFDSSRQEFYQALGWLCAASSVPRIVLADASWPDGWIRQFSAHRVLSKPFSMETVGRAIEEVVLTHGKSDAPDNASK